MLTSYRHIKDCTLVALAYYRQIETGSNSIGDIDFHPGSGRVTSKILESFCLVRSVDFAYLTIPGDPSTFFRDLGQLAAEIESPARIFEGQARQTAIEVVHHIVNIEGWTIGNRPGWEAAMRAVNPSLPVADRAQLFHAILEQHVTFSGDPVDAFLASREWGKQNGLWPRR